MYLHFSERKVIIEVMKSETHLCFLLYHILLLIIGIRHLPNRLFLLRTLGSLVQFVEFKEMLNCIVRRSW